METDLVKFMMNITINDKDFSMYRDLEKGVILPLNTIRLLVSLDYYEMEQEQYDMAVFQKKINKDLTYNKTKITKPVPKNEITGKDSDKNTIVDKEVEVYQIWNAVNAYGAFKSFNDKKEAIKFVEDLNFTVFNALEVK